MRSALVLACCACTVPLGGNDAGYEVGPAGRVITIAGRLSLEVPPGALRTVTRVTVTQSDAPAGALSPRLSFEPEVTLDIPATLTLPVDASAVTLYWNDAFVPASVASGVAKAQISRFGSGYFFGRPPPERTVHGRLSTVYGSAVAGGALSGTMHVTALWSGSDRFPVIESPDFTFTVPGVPQGRYLLEVDTLYNATDYAAQLFEFTVDTPDLSIVSAARPDVRLSTQPTPVTLSVANMLPWVLPDGNFTGDILIFASAEANVFARPRAHPAASATSFQGNIDWRQSAISTGMVLGLPRAGDVLWAYQRSTSPLGSGVVHRAARFQRLDSVTIADGAAANLSLSLADAPQTGSLHADIRGSQWAALASQVNPNASFSTLALGGVSVLATPRSIAFPDMPAGSATTSLAWVQPPDGVDVNYGNVAYGQFLGPSWKEFRYALYSYETPDLAIAGSAFSMEPMPATSPVAPRLGPPRSPQIAGRDAFLPQSGVGLQPTISWSPPSLGTATSYVVRIGRFAAGPGLQTIELTVHSGMSVALPPGFLQAGVQYWATIAAQSAPWDVADVPAFRTGLPFDYTECATGLFTP